MNCSVSPLWLVPLLLSVLSGCATPPERVQSDGSAAASRGFAVRPVEGLGLFSDEQRKSQQLVAAALQARGVRVADVGAVERAWALAAEGRNPLTGASCGRPLSEWEARRRWGATLGLEGSAGTYVGCEDDGGCSVSVSASRLDDEGGAPFSFEAPLRADGPALAALAEAMPKLTPPPPPGGGGGNVFGAGGLGSQSVQANDVLAQYVSSADARTQGKVPDELPFPGLTLMHAAVCLAPGKDSVGVTAEFAADGRITRCEGSDVRDRDAGRCACGQLERVSRAPWLNGKRWHVSLNVDRADQLSADQQLVVSAYWNTHLVKQQRTGQPYPTYLERIEDPSLQGWSPGSTRQVTDCFVGAFEKPGRISSRWAVWFDAAGRATKVREQKAWPWLSKEVGACVVQVLLTATAPCPSRGGLWAMVDLHANARDPKVKEKSLGALLEATDAGVPEAVPGP